MSAKSAPPFESSPGLTPQAGAAAPFGPALPARTVAVIDVGTSSIRMAIAQIDGHGSVEILENLSQGVRLGKDTFTRGELSRATIEESVRVLRAYRQKLEEYGVSRPEQIRVVATSAVREATNRLSFLDRVYVATGLSIEPIEEAEVHRITYRSIQPLLLAEPRLAEGRTVICEVGGGSTELLLVDHGNVAFSHSFRLGSLRLRQTLQSLRAPQDRLREIMESVIERTLETVPELIPQGSQVRLIGLGGDIRFVVRELAPNWDAHALAQLPVDRFGKLTDKVLRLTEDALVAKMHVTFPEAETLGPALLVYLHLARLLGANEVLASAANLRDGLLREMRAGGVWTEDFRQQIVRSAVELGRKYHIDEEHGLHVARLSRQLFEALRDDHGLEPRYELLLFLAAILHEVGAYVSSTSLHKHSMYLITNSDLFGLGSQDMMLVGLVARYHRRASPKPTHREFNQLDRDRRVAVLKMAAILRLAIALNASRSQVVQEFSCSRSAGRLEISVPHVEDLSVEQLAIKQGSGMFEEVFGMKVLLRTEDLPELRGTSSQL